MPIRGAHADAYDRLRVVVDAAEPTIRARALKALRALQASVPTERLEKALRSRDAFAIGDLASALPAQLRPAVTTLTRVFERGGSTGMQLLQAVNPRGAVRGRFDGRNQFAAAAARRNAARFVTQVTTETQKAIRRIVSRSFTEGITPAEAARMIRPLIGLTPKQAGAVDGRRRDLIEDGVSSRRANELAARYASQLLARRAEIIARTEVIRASSAGQIAAWEGAVADGILGSRAQMVWIVTNDDRVCPICAPLDGATAPLGGKFQTSVGAVDGPPAHPNCRCALGVEPEAPQAPQQDRTAATPEAIGDRPLPPVPPDTLTQFRGEDGTWDVKREALHRRILRAQLTGVQSDVEPTVYMTGGGPASGKSLMLGSGKVNYPTHGRAVHVDPDALKAKLPEYKRMVAAGNPAAAGHVHEESSYLAKRLWNEALASGRSVVLDAVGDGTIEALRQRVAQMRDAGATRIVANYATLDTDLAIKYADLRAAQTGRKVPHEYLREMHGMVSETLPKAIEAGIFDEVNLWDTNLSGNPRLVLSAGRGRKTVIHNKRLWQDFLAKARR